MASIFSLPFDASDIMIMKAFVDNVAIVRNDGKIFLFGNNAYGQLCHSTLNTTLSVSALNLSQVDFISIGVRHSLFVALNQIYSCGSNSFSDFNGQSVTGVSNLYNLYPTKVECDVNDAAKI